MNTIQANQTALGRKSKVQNRAPAPVQITAEQILLEARAHQEVPVKPPKQQVTDAQELVEFRTRRRKEFEDRLRMRRGHVGTYISYAAWEESQFEIERARNVFERAIDVDYRDGKIWLKYAQMEMRHKFINRARNVFDRAVSLLPRVDTFWYKYTYMEEMVGNINNARQIFERWMQWEPAEQAWLSYANLEIRQGETDRARHIYERYIACHSTIKAYLKFAKWEERQSQPVLARELYERALTELGDDARDEQLFIAFGEFEERCHEFVRARAIFKSGLELLPRESAGELYKTYVNFEKKHGDREGVEDVVVRKRREQYEEALDKDPLNYDIWFDYVRLEEGEAGGNCEQVRNVYKRAVANIPPVAEKRYWKRYIYLWINFALYEELTTKDYERCRQVYTEALSVIPHHIFTFSKLWILAAKFELRRKELGRMRKILGRSLGVAPRETVIQFYIDLEYQLLEVDRCRKLYAKYLEIMPYNSNAWSKFAEMEAYMGEVQRARSIFELAVSQSDLDTPEVLWKRYIDFEIAQVEQEKDQEQVDTQTVESNWDTVRNLFKRLLQLSQHVKVWSAYAAFESDHVEDSAMARNVYKLAEDHFSTAIKEAQKEAKIASEDAEAMKQKEDDLDTIADTETVMQQHTEQAQALAAAAAAAESAVLQLKEQRVMLLEAWHKMEISFGNAEEAKSVKNRLPRRLKRRRQVFADDGITPIGWEEYFDYVFPEENKSSGSLRLLQMAQLWKQGKLKLGSKSNQTEESNISQNSESMEKQDDRNAKRKYDESVEDVADVHDQNGASVSRRRTDNSNHSSDKSASAEPIAEDENEIDIE